jgi:pSer/pThr/pTyr-binding forkhead associated (FHA) protein
LRELRITYDDGEILSIPLVRGPFVLGRSDSAHLSCPKDFALSRTHCLLNPEGDEWSIEDLGSRNGTLINGSRIDRRERLRPGDVIIAGHLALRYADPNIPTSPGRRDYDGSSNVADSGMDSEDPEGTFIVDQGDPGVESPSPQASEFRTDEVRPTGLAWLHILKGPYLGSRYSLAKDFSIGRDRNSDLILSDRVVSRYHAHIVLENRRFYIYNKGTNGTLINGIRIEGRQGLLDRDEIRVGSTALRFIQPVGQEEMSPPGRRRLRDFDQIWTELTDAARLDASHEFASAAERLVRGLLAETLGLTVESVIPYRAGIVGCMVQAPGLRIRKPHFPVLVVRYSEPMHELQRSIAVQLAAARATDYFVLFIVVPVGEAVVDEAQSLREHVVNRAARHDLVVLDQQHLAELIGLGSTEHLLKIILHQGIDLSVLSPYIVAGAVSGQMFFGREKEVKMIKQTIQAASYAIVGGRRIGKSSIVQKVAALLNDDATRYCAHQINCEHIFNQRDFFATVRDELQIACEDDAASFRKAIIAEKQRIGQGSMIILMDEVDMLLNCDGDSTNQGHLFRVFRSLSHEGACRFVFSGSRTLYEHLRSPSSPFFNFVEDMVLGILDRESVSEIVSKPLRQLGIEMDDEIAIVDAIADYSSCHPNLAQWICDRLLRTITVHRITMADVRSVVDSREFCEHYVRTAWGEAAPLERLISIITNTSHFTLDDVRRDLSRFGINDRLQIQSAIEMLQLGVLLQRDPDDKRYRMSLTHFPRLVRVYEDADFQIQTLLKEIEG